MELAHIKSKLLNGDISGRTLATIDFVSVSDDGTNSPFFIDREVRKILLSVLSSDPHFSVRDVAGKLIADILGELPPIDRFREFIRMVRFQNLAGFRDGDPRVGCDARFDPSIARFNQVSTLVRALQILANKPLADVENHEFFLLLGESGLLAELSQSATSHENYRSFINSQFMIKGEVFPKVSLPTAFVSSCITAVRRAHVLNCFYTGDYSIVGNRDLLSRYKTLNELAYATHALTVRGIIYTLHSILRHFKGDSRFVGPSIEIARLHRFFNQKFPGHLSL